MARSVEELTNSNPLGFLQAKLTLTTAPVVGMMRGLQGVRERYGSKERWGELVPRHGTSDSRIRYAITLGWVR